jgi:hypothetical protein
MHIRKLKATMPEWFFYIFIPFIFIPWIVQDYKIHVNMEIVKFA